MSNSGTGNEKASLSATYVAEGTYPSDICVLRYALERNARDKPDDVFAAFEGGERWTFAQTLQQVESFAGNLHELGVRQGDTLSWYCRHLLWRCGQCSPSTISERSMFRSIRP